MVSMKDISIACNVSVATVSKALNDHKDISEETKNKIKETAKQMGYHPNSLARALKTNKTYNIGVLFEDEEGSGLTYDYFSYMLHYFKSTVEKKGYDITFLNNHAKPNMSFLEHCRYRNFDGVFIACTNFYDPQVLELIQSNIPVVTIDHVFENCINIVSDNVDGMTQLVTHAYEMGHRRIAYIHGQDSAVTRSRLSTFYYTAEKLGFEVPEEYVLEAPYRDSVAAQNQTKKLLELPVPPTCILFPDDFTCYGGMNAIIEKQLKVPDDISIIGYDGTRSGQIQQPKLTTLHQDTNRLGKLAGEMLLSLIEHPKTTLHQSITVKGNMYEGGTVKNLN